MPPGWLEGDSWTWPATWAFPAGKDAFEPIFGLQEKMFSGLCLGLVNGRTGSGPSTHNAFLFSVGEGSLPRLEKENVCDWLGVRNNGPLMLVYSNVHITEEFSIFGVTFDAVVWDSFEA